MVYGNILCIYCTNPLSVLAVEVSSSFFLFSSLYIHSNAMNGSEKEYRRQKNVFFSSFDYEAHKTKNQRYISSCIEDGILWLSEIMSFSVPCTNVSSVQQKKGFILNARFLHNMVNEFRKKFPGESYAFRSRRIITLFR